MLCCCVSVDWNVAFVLVCNPGVGTYTLFIVWVQMELCLHPRVGMYIIFTIQLAQKRGMWSYKSWFILCARHARHDVMELLNSLVSLRG